jgi:signal transduction histidine kinase
LGTTLGWCLMAEREEWERLLDELRAEFTLREQELDLLHEIDLLLLEPERPLQEEPEGTPQEEAERTPQAIFSFIVQRTQQLLQASHTTILLRRSTFLEPMYSNLESVVGQRVPISESLTGLSLETNELVNVSDLTTDLLKARYTQLRGYEGPAMRSLLATPIIIRGTTVGVLNAESQLPDAFKPVHERIATAVASQVAIALEQTQTLASSILFADVDRLMFASNDSQHVVQHSEHVIQVALERVMAELKRVEHIHHTGAQIMFLRGEDELEIVHSTNPVDIGLILQVNKSVSGRAVRERKTVIVRDVHVDNDYQMLVDSIRSEIVVPILFGEDDLVIGVLNVESSEEDAFSGFYQIVLESFAEKVRTLLAFAKLRADVTEALELRSADDLLLAVGDQTSNLVHRLNNTVGAMRVRILELQEMQDGKGVDEGFLRSSLDALLDLADRTLKMPEEISLLLAQEGTTVDVNDCVRKAVNQIGLPKDVELELRLADNIPPLSLYNFDVVIQNLLKNGIDAMPKGGQLSVCTSVVPGPIVSKGYLQLFVHDTGTGIPVEIQRRIFELNFTTKKEKGKGLGLGLWWVRTFVRRARGDITIRSTPGNGTDVVVKIPLTRPDGDAQVANKH